MSASAVGRARARNVAQGHAEPARRADERTAHLVRDAHERGHRLLLREGDEVVPAQHDLLLDQPVHAQAPGRGIDLRHHEGGVDAVEVGRRRDDGGEAVDAEVGGIRDRRRRDGRRQPQSGAHGADRAGAAAQRDRDERGERPGHHRDAGQGQHAAARDAVGRGVAVGGGASARSPQAGDQQGARHGRPRAAMRRGHRREAVSRVGARHRHDGAENAQTREHDAPPRRTTVLERPAAPRDDQQQHRDADEKGGLVARPEEVDGEVFRPGRGEVDHRAPDHRERTRRRSRDRRGQLAEPRPEHGRGDPRDDGGQITQAGGSGGHPRSIGSARDPGADGGGTHRQSASADPA